MRDKILSFQFQCSGLGQEPGLLQTGAESDPGAEFHLAVRADDYEEMYEKHKEMGCICFENPAMGIYFISDPDGYWIEIVPEAK